MLILNNYSPGNWDYTTLKSISSGVYWYVTVPSGVTVSGVTVSDSNASSGVYITALTSSGNIDAGNNLNWIFNWTAASGVTIMLDSSYIIFDTFNSNIYTGASFSGTIDSIIFEPLDVTVSYGNNIYIDNGFIIFKDYPVSVIARSLYCDGPKFEYPNHTSGQYNYPERITGNYNIIVRISGGYNSPSRTTTCRYRFN